MEKFEQHGFSTLADFAFCGNYTPGAAGDAKFLIEAKKILGVELPKINPLRRLHFEAYTLLQADMRRQIEKVDEDKPRPLSIAERNARRTMLAPQLEGLDMNGIHNVSDALVDQFSHLKETQKLKWPAWEDCASKQEDNNGVKSLPTWKADANGIVKEVQGEVKATTQANTDYNLHNLFIRRGIAAAMGNVMTFKNHQRLAQRLMGDLAATPPPGYQKVSYTQVRNADQKLCELLSLEVQEGIEDVDGTRANVDMAVGRVLVDPRSPSSWPRVSGRSHQRGQQAATRTRRTHAR